MTTVKEKENPNERLEQDEIIDFEEVSGRRSAPRDINLGGGGVDKYKNLIIAALGAAVLGVGAFFAYSWFTESQEGKASDDAIHAFKYYEKDSLDRAINGVKPYKGLKTLTDDYSGTKTGNIAKYMLGTAYLNKGKIKEGVALLEEFTKENTMVSASAYDALGYGYEELKQFDKAAEAYVNASKVNANDITTPEYLIKAAAAYQEAKATDKALSIYKEIKQKYPTSEPGAVAEKYISALSNE